MDAKRKNAAAVRGVPIKLLMEEFVSRMAPKLSDAATRDVPIKSLWEEMQLRGMYQGSPEGRSMCHTWC